MTQSARIEFSPAESGTDERIWRCHLAAVQSWQPAGRNLVVVSPHPDDEVLGVGGLMCSWARHGGSVSVLSVTDGEGAYCGVDNLDLIRRAELQRALSLLSPRIVTRALHLPDGQVAAHQTQLVRSVSEALTPGCTLLLPYEHDGHCDHEAVGSLAAHFPHVAVARYPIWLWHHGNPETTVGTLRMGRFMLPPAIRRAKARAIACFQSQISPPHGLPILPPQVLAHFNRPYETVVL